jgi:RNA polymerase sigma factor (sigma-70 family)
MTDEQQDDLWGKAGRGNKGAQAILVEYRLPQVIGDAKRFWRLGEHVVDDLIQEGVFAVYRLAVRGRTDDAPFGAIAQMAARRAMVTWLRNTQGHRAMRVPERRRQGVRPVSLDAMEAEHWMAAPVSQPEYGPDEIRKLHRLLAGLPERERDVVVRRARGEQTRDIAKAYGTGDWQIGELEDRALRLLRARWDRTSPPMTTVRNAPCRISKVTFGRDGGRWRSSRKTNAPVAV